MLVLFVGRFNATGIRLTGMNLKYYKNEMPKRYGGFTLCIQHVQNLYSGIL